MTSGPWYRLSEKYPKDESEGTIFKIKTPEDIRPRLNGFYIVRDQTLHSCDNSRMIKYDYILLSKFHRRNLLKDGLSKIEWRYINETEMMAFL